MKNDFLNLYSETNVGNKRPANEDFLGYSESPNGLIYVVCDGMGGHVGGATASQLAVVPTVLRSKYLMWPLSRTPSRSATRWCDLMVSRRFFSALA